MVRRILGTQEDMVVALTWRPQKFRLSDKHRPLARRWWKNSQQMLSGSTLSFSLVSWSPFLFFLYTIRLSSPNVVYSSKVFPSVQFGRALRMDIEWWSTQLVLEVLLLLFHEKKLISTKFPLLLNYVIRHFIYEVSMSKILGFSTGCCYVVYP